MKGYVSHLNHRWEMGREQHILCAECSVLLYSGGLPRTTEEKANIVAFLDGRPGLSPPKKVRRYRRRT